MSSVRKDFPYYSFSDRSQLIIALISLIFSHCLCPDLFASAALAAQAEKYAEAVDQNLLVMPASGRRLTDRRQVANATGFDDRDEGRAALEKGEMSARVKQIADITETTTIVAELRKLQNQLRGVPTGQLTGADRSASIVRLIYLRGKLVQYLQTVSFEVNAVKAEVELAIAKIDDARAQIVERRARVLKRNSIINFVSGGVTKMVGYSLAIASNDLPTNLLEILDGGIQSSLSGMAVKEQEEEKHFDQAVPTLLSTIIDNNNDTTRNYPSSVWQYLTSQSFNGEEIISESTQNLGGDTTGGETRRGKLIAAWSTSGMLGRHRAPLIKGVHPPMARVGQGKSVTAQLLEDRAAMLSDLKSVVAQMNSNLMQLSQLVKASYLQDPPL
ncbi:MAG: hypothetical protein KGS72_19935 [Cyanobacteria bacterium REEB67]|nr:hypothetical protein [Cyanobacteria bacterium REEB67]